MGFPKLSFFLFFFFHDRIVYKVTRDSSSVSREIFLSLVEALHSSGCQACRGGHFPVVEQDDGTGLVLCLALLGCQSSCCNYATGTLTWARQSTLGILQYTSGLEVLAYSFDTDFNYNNFIPAKWIFIAIVIFLRIVFCVRNDQKISKSGGL